MVKKSKMVTLEELNDAKKLARLKKRTADFIAKIGWKPGSKILADIPWDLIVIPSYQESRALKAEKSSEITKIVANFDENKCSPVTVSLRTTGSYAGLFFIVDGYHRARTLEIINEDSKKYEGVESKILSLDANSEIDVFQAQTLLSTKVSEHIRYEALVESTDESNVDVQSAWNVRDVLNKYHMVDALTSSRNDRYCRLGVGEALKISKDEIIKGKDGKFDWIIEILKTSGFAKQSRGLSANMITIMGAMYDAFADGRFDNVTINDAKIALIKKLKNQNWNTLEAMGSYIYEENAATSRATETRARVKAAIAYLVCDYFGLQDYVLRAPAVATAFEPTN